MADRVLHGWLSEECAKLHGGSYYKTPNGGKIRITQVTETMNHGCAWKDIQYVGKVTEWCGKFEPTENNFTKEVFREGRVSEEMTFTVIKNRTPQAPCPLAYTGTGNCTCGKCRTTKRTVNRNPFGY